MSIASSAEIYMLSLINAHRASIGLPALRLEQNLNTSAEKHSAWMFDTGTFSHVGVKGSSEIDRMRDAGFSFQGESRGSENLAIVPNMYGESMEESVRALHQSLMDSPSHYATLVNPNFEVIGIGIVSGTFNFQGTRAAAVGVTQNFGQTDAALNFDPGNSSIRHATAFDDLVRGTTRSDRLNGFDGDDRLAGRGGRDRLEGDGGNDRLLGQGGNDKLFGDTGADRLVGGAGHDQLSGGTGRDTLLGGSGNDRLKGNGGNDVLSGEKGDDKLYGNGGRDRLEGGAGADKLWGGGGKDTFVFYTGDDADIVNDFKTGTDRIDLTGFVFGSVDEAMRHADQSGRAVVFDFGNGDILTVNNVFLTDISGDLLL